MSTDAFATFVIAGTYLLSRGWKRDGDDPGVWVSPEGAAWGFGDALTLQLDADGVRLTDGPQSA